MGGGVLRAPAFNGIVAFGKGEQHTADPNEGEACKKEPEMLRSALHSPDGGEKVCKSDYAKGNAAEKGEGCEGAKQVFHKILLFAPP